MKKFYLFILLQAMVMLSMKTYADEIIIGTGTNATNSAPYNTLYKYSTTKTIYSSNAIGKTGKITSIAYQVRQAKALSTVDLKIYMGTTTKSYFSSSDDNTVPKNLVLVYEGSPELGTTTGWESLDLDTPYEYDGKENLMVVVCRNSDSNQYNLYYYYTSDYNTGRDRGSNSTSSICDVTNVSDSYTTSSYRPNIKINIDTTPFESEIFTLNGIKYETQLGFKCKVLSNSYSGEISIPSSIEHGGKTYWIVEITPGVLDNCTSVSLPVYYNFGSNAILKKLYIEEGPTTFTGFSSCTALEDVSLPGSLTSIQYTFTDCTSLKTVAFRYGTTKLKGLEECSSYGGTFRKCKIDSIFVDREFDFSFTSSYSSPFSWNGTKHTLRVVRIGDNLKTVQANMFYNCNELKTIILGNSLTTIENNGFGDCEKVEGDLVMPSTLKTIGNYAFSYGWHLAGEGKIVLNEGLETIGASAFANCPKLNVEYFPSTVISIGNFAFNDCKFEKLTIPNKVTSIGENAFYRGAEELIIEDGTSTLSLSSHAFGYDTKKLKKLYLGRNITHNESSGGPFEYCYASTHTLQNVEIGDKVTSIPANTFYRCSALETVTIGSKVSSIGKDAFNGTGLIEVMTKAVTAPTLSAQEFSGKPVYVPAGSKASYLAKDYWKNNIIIDPNDELITVNLTMPGTLEGRLRIQKVEPANVNKLKITGEMNDDDWAYIKKTNMPNMYSLDLSEVTNTSIPAQQFQAHILVNAVLPNGITTIGDYAFEGSNLSGDFSMPSSLVQIGNYAFKGTKIGNVSLSSNVTIGNYAFNNSKLKSITLNKCTSIGQYAFAGCSNLNGSYQLHPQLTAIPDYAFQNCSSLEGIELPQTLKTIGNGAFQNCSKLTNLEFHNTITSFGSTTSSFAGCSGIKTIKTHWMRPISTMSTTFDSVDKSSCTLYVPNGSTDWYLITTGWKEFINVVEYDETETLGDLVIVDATEFVPVPGLYSNLSYSRNYSHTNWQALYVPFAMNYDDWSESFDVAYINNMNQYDTDEDGLADMTVMEIIKVTSGSIEPNTPYLIRAKEAGEKTITLTDATLYQTEENSFDVTSWKLKFTFTGTYSQIGGSTMVANGYYALGNGALHQAENTDANLNAFRWYMHVTDRQGNTQTLGRVMVHDFEEDDLPAGIGTLLTDECLDSLYHLDGTKSSGSASGLLIKNGKVVFIRQ